MQQLLKNHPMRREGQAHDHVADNDDRNIVVFKGSRHAGRNHRRPSDLADTMHSSMAGRPTTA